MKEVDSDNHISVITQYEDFETNQNVITLYEKWEQIDNTYNRNIKVYNLENLSDSKILSLLEEDVNSLEDILGSPISEKVETRNYLDESELKKSAYLKASIYSVDKDEYYYVDQPIENNIVETILWFIALLFLESIALIYRCFSSFSYSKTVKKINSFYSINTIEMLEKRLKILDTYYRVLKEYNDLEINESIISKYLDNKTNIEFSKMSDFDLRNILMIAIQMEPTLRNTLYYDELYTYGTEIELENVKKKKFVNNLSKFKSLKWKLVNDTTLHNGIEIVSPILKDTKECWNELNDVCKSTDKLASIDKNCGLHVHIGAHILGNDKKAWMNFIKLFATYENIIFRFAYGEFYNYRDNILEFANPVSNELWKDYLNLKKKNADTEEIINIIKHGKYNAINFEHVKYDNINQIVEGNTIEIRCGNGCKNAVIIQNYINFLLSLFKYAKSDKYNDAIIDKRHEQSKNIYGNIDMYNDIYLEQALELCDLIYDNNLDKILFLNQYIKDFKIEKFNRNKTFTKKIKK